jgi:hypothetical protein
MHFLARPIASWVPYPATAFSTGCILKASNAPLALRPAYGQQHGRLSAARRVAHAVARGVAQSTTPVCYCWAAGARPVSIPARAQALMLRKDASCLRALGFTTASLLCTAHVSLPAPRSRRAPAGQGQDQRQRRAQDWPSKRSECSLRVRVCAPALPRPTADLFPRFARSYPGRRSAALRASEKHRISRAWERSLRCRSLGLAPASSVTGSVSAGALPSPFAALGRLITFSPALWGPAQLSLKYAKVLAAFAPVAGATYALQHGVGCERSPEKLAMYEANAGSTDQLWSKHFFHWQPKYCETR